MGNRFQVENNREHPVKVSGSLDELNDVSSTELKTVRY